MRDFRRESKVWCMIDLCAKIFIKRIANPRRYRRSYELDWRLSTETLALVGIIRNANLLNLMYGNI